MTYVNPNLQAGIDLEAKSARVYHDVDQSIPDSVNTALSFNSERWDTDDIHNTVTNNNRLTCNTAGKYLLIGQIVFAINATGNRGIVIRLNGVTSLARAKQVCVAGVPPALVVSTIYDLSVGDYVELLGFQTSGDVLDVVYSGNYSPEFMMHRIG